MHDRKVVHFEINVSVNSNFLNYFYRLPQDSTTGITDNKSRGHCNANWLHNVCSIA